MNNSSDPSSDVSAIAERTGFPVDAVESMARSIAHGGGRMAQFDHPAFGGPGQWMHGGMLMISDLFDHTLKQRVARLCELLAEGEASVAQVQRQQQGAEAVGPADRASAPDAAPTWYPAALGVPSSSGAQNRTRYAWFAGARRLAVDDGERVTIYDTGDHAIGGVSQQQGRRGSVAFTSQHGSIDLASLPVVDGAAPRPVAPEIVAETPAPPTDPFQALEKLAALHARGIVSDDEFTAKRTELLERI